MNDVFKQNILNIYSSKGQKWLNYLPDIVQEIAEKWSLSGLRPVDDLSMNYVLSGFQDNSEIILKISLDEDLIFREMTALTALFGYGAVEILAYQLKTLLLKKLSPATSLKTYLPDRKKQALQIACEVTKKLLSAPKPHNIKLPSIENRFSLLDQYQPIPKDYLEKARVFRDEILNNNMPRFILHGDLHHDNLLKDAEDWKVIDPQGVIGLPINEVWAFIVDTEEDIPFITKYFNFNETDLEKAYFMHTVLSSLWAIEDNMDPKFWLEKADKVQL